jgi:hypothetical protein
MPTTKIEYLAGVCNIGPEEIARRRNLGWIGLAVAIVLLAILVWAGVNPWWRLFVFFPAMLSASGFLQAYFRFCSGYARRGVFNFGSLGATHPVTDATSKTKDRKQGNRIMLWAVLIGAVAAIVVVLL